MFQVSSFKFHKRNAFTLIELLVVIAIFAIILGITATVYYSWGKQADINTATQSILSTLNSAKNKTLASEGASKYGMHFDEVQGQFILFKGDIFDPLAADNEVLNLSSAVEIASVSLAGEGSDVIFNRLTGTTDNFGTVSLRLKRDLSIERTINIYFSGEVGTEGTTPPLNSRVKDSRHVHFDLGWSIQGSTTLTLDFVEHVENISMADYFSAGDSEFDWEGTVNVDGDEQKLRIHTHLLTATDTLFCIHRDRRYNNKSLTVSIDGKEIVSYSADGQAVVGIFGGVMSEQ